MRPKLAALLIFATMLVPVGFAPAQTQQVGQAPSSTTRKCSVDPSRPTDGDAALSRDDYTTAEAVFRAALAKDPGSEAASLGLVRSLIGEDKSADARALADGLLIKHPQSALAEVAVAESAYRAADFATAKSRAAHALQDNGCEPQALAIVAKLYAITARFATAARLLATAHAIRPNDDLIRRDWIQSLPRQQRTDELAKYLRETSSLDAKTRDSLGTEEAFLKARHPGDCRVTAKSDNVKLLLKPVYASFALQPTAYGLDVSINGKSRRLQVDSGASGIVLTPAAAKRIGLTPEFQVHAGGIGDEGDVGSYITHVASIQIGDVELSNCTVEVLEKSKLDVDGLIGTDVFRRWLVILEYEHADIRLAPLPAVTDAKSDAGAAVAVGSPGAPDQEDDRPVDATVPAEMKDWLPVVRVGHQILLPSRLNKGPLHYVIADTGASSTTFSTALAAEVGKLQEDSTARFEGISGEVKKVYKVSRASLIFGTLALPPQDYPAFDITSISHDSGMEVSGLLGLPTLSRLTISIDYRDNLIQMKFDKAMDYRLF